MALLTPLSLPFKPLKFMVVRLAVYIKTSFTEIKVVADFTMKS